MMCDSTSVEVFVQLDVFLPCGDAHVSVFISLQMVPEHTRLSIHMCRAFPFVQYML